MNHKDFESRLLKIQGELSLFLDKNLSEEDLKIQNLFNQINDNLIDKEKFLKSLEDKVVEDKKKNDKLIIELKNSIIIKFQEIEDQIRKYNEYHTVTNKKEQLELKKDEELRDYRIAKKREKLDKTNKIHSFEKELSQKIKEIEVKLVEEEKVHKSKKTELLRRLNIDIQRVNDANIKEYSDIEKFLLETNKTKDIHESKKKIKKVRISGLNTQINLKKSYYKYLFDEEIRFLKIKEKLLLDDNILREEYRLKIEELKAQIIKLEYDELNAETIRDFDIAEKILEYMQESNKKIENLKGDYVNYFVDVNNNIVNHIYSFNNDVRNNVLENVNETFKFDISQLSNLKTIYEISRNSIDEEIKYITSSTIQFINLFKDYLINILSKQINIKNNYTLELYKFLLIYKNNNKFLNISFDKYINEMHKMNEEYTKNQRLRLEEFKKDIFVSFRLIIKQIDDMISNINKYRNDELNYENTYLENIYKPLNLVNSEAINAYKIFEQKNKLEVEEEVANYKNINNIEINKQQQFINGKNEELKKSYIDLNKTKEDYFSRSISSSYEDIAKDINNKIVMLNKKYKDQLKKMEIEIMNNYKSNIQLLNKEKKEKMRIL